VERKVEENDFLQKYNLETEDLNESRAIIDGGSDGEKR
jgi:hypothetical protein